MSEENAAERYDRRELVRRSAGAAVALGSGSGWLGDRSRLRGPKPEAVLRTRARVRWRSHRTRRPGICDGPPIVEPALRRNPPLGVASVADGRGRPPRDRVGEAIRRSTSRPDPVATRSAGFSTTTGLVVDLSACTTVELGADGSAAVKGGRKARPDLRDASGHRADGRCRSGPAPRWESPGLTLGGGHGFSSRALGLACDNVTWNRDRDRRRTPATLRRTESSGSLLGIAWARVPELRDRHEVMFRTHPVGTSSRRSI